MEDLRCQLQEINGLANELNMRLSPVLMPDCPQPCDPSTKQPHLVTPPLVEQLQAFSRMARDAIFTLSNIHTRLQL